MPGGGVFVNSLPAGTFGHLKLKSADGLIRPLAQQHGVDAHRIGQMQFDPAS
jgi:hypothetical protein